METFFRDDEGYAQWRKSHRGGFILKKGSKVLHGATCDNYIGYDAPRTDGEGEPWRTTSTRKLCFDDIRAVELWARESGVVLRPCSECEPDPPSVSSG